MEKKNKQTNTTTSSQGRYKKRSFEKSQTRFSLRIDDDLVEWVASQSETTTKNRYINGLIRKDMEASLLKDMAIKNGMTVGEVMTESRMSFEDFDKRVTDKVKEEVARHQRVR